MTVGELRRELDNLDPELLVVLQKDSEGNGYSPLSDFEVLNYVPETTWYGEIRYPELTPELEAAGYGEEDIYNGEDAVHYPCIPPVFPSCVSSDDPGVRMTQWRSLV
jgi:hypothetical protein